MMAVASIRAEAWPEPPPVGGGSREQLRILIVSTPKTGNTWLKHLLAAAYDLPMPLLPTDARQIDWAGLGPRWVAHQHYAPEAPLLEAAAAHGVILLTTVRHPADVFVSLVHYGRRQDLPPADGPEDLGYLRGDAAPFGAHALAFLREGFCFQLHLSLSWLRGGWARAVRYEDLWRRPVTTLRRLTDAILPLSDTRLRLAIGRCELRAMRRALDPERAFFRKGGVGGWRAALPPDFQAILMEVEPYPEQFAALGYSMDASDPANAPAAPEEMVADPFRRGDRFDHGPAVCPIVLEVFHHLPDEFIARWPDALTSGPGSFYAWLNSPAGPEPEEAGAYPVVTQLAHYLHRARPDLQAAYPDPFGRDRDSFALWFCTHGRQAYALDAGFCLPVRPVRRADGSRRPNPWLAGGTFQNGVPVAPVLAAWYGDLPEAEAARWAEAVRTGDNALFDWFNAPATEDPHRGERVPVVTELAAYLYRTRADAQEVYPDPYGRNRVELADWFLTVARSEYHLHRAFRVPVLRSVALGRPVRAS